MTMWHGIGRQLGHPTGWRGRAIGKLMGLANRTPNRLALEALALAPGEPVLELGFGPGEALTAMSRTDCGAIHGIDRSAAMVRQATRRNRAAVDSGRITLQQGDFASLPYPDASFAKVLGVNVVYFWHRPAPVVREIRRVLRPGGALILYATAESSMRGWRFAGPETHRQFDEAAIVALLSDGGFAPQLIEVDALRVVGTMKGLVVVARTEGASTARTEDATRRRT